MFAYRGFQCVNHLLKVRKAKPKLLSDISNVAGHYDENPPKIKNINLMYNNLKYDYYITGIADWELYYCIDYRPSYEYYLRRRIILEAPQGIEADILLILKAIQDDCPILTNDTFRDHMDLIPSELWLYTHRIPFDIIKGEFRIYPPK